MLEAVLLRLSPGVPISVPCTACKVLSTCTLCPRPRERFPQLAFLKPSSQPCIHNQYLVNNELVREWALRGEAGWNHSDWPTEAGWWRELWCREYHAAIKNHANEKLMAMWKSHGVWSCENANPNLDVAAISALRDGGRKIATCLRLVCVT